VQLLLLWYAEPACGSSQTCALVTPKEGDPPSTNLAVSIGWSGGASIALGLDIRMLLVGHKFQHGAGTRNKGKIKHMKLKFHLQLTAILAVAVVMTAASATGATIYFNTNAAGTEYTPSDSLVLHNSSGQSATLTFSDNPTSNVGVPPPSEVDLGHFDLVCSTCGTQASLVGSTFGSFTIDIIVTECSNLACSSTIAVGEYVGTSTGGLVYSDSSAIVINFSPLQLGTGTNNATSGNFGATDFIIANGGVVDIVAPNQGSTPGETTVQAQANSNATPEPTTLSLLMGGGLLGLGLLRRKTAGRSSISERSREV
jgi:hypothetical protein